MTPEERKAIEERVADPDPDRCLDILGLYKDASNDRAALLDALREAEADVARQKRALYRLAALVFGIQDGLSDTVHSRYVSSYNRIRARLAALEEER